MLGTVTFPDFAVSLGNGETTDIDIICNITPGNVDGIKPALMDYLSGRVKMLKVQGESNISLRSGIIPLGTHKIIQDVTFESVSPHLLVPFNPIVADVAGTIQSIPFALIETCPGTGTSPLDDLLRQYVRGGSSTVYIRGLPVDDTNSGLPAWASDILTSVTVPVPFPGGHAFKDLLKSFSLMDVKFIFPDPNARPGTPESSPRFSATVKAIVSIPREVNAPLDVSKIIANGDISYHSKKLGEFHFPHWALATTVPHDDSHELEINARVENVPINITDTDVFSDVLQDIISGGGVGVTLRAIGTADVKVGIASLGAFVVRGIPAQGDVVIKGGANVTFNNPTNYTAQIPYVNIKFTKNDTVLGNGTIRDIIIGLKENTAILEAFWAPADGGDLAWATGVALLGDYISGL
ncbi:hypothetical protein AA313_de0208027 [Arthrobotrys entomopaga]|nr:hypothetical protein AA313_de0208027 [Arthrobotrys entomopaga]